MSGTTDQEITQEFPKLPLFCRRQLRQLRADACVVASGLIQLKNQTAAPAARRITRTEVIARLAALIEFLNGTLNAK